MRTGLLAMLVSAAALADAPPIQKHVLPNGLQVVVVESHAVPLVTVEIAFKNGSMTEPPEYNGLSHLYEHMFFKANSVLPSQEAFMQRGRELGLLWNGTTDTERVNYFFSTSKDNFDGAMVFMRDAITSPLFDAKELDRERVVVTGEIDRNESQPGYHFWHDVEQRVWWKYPSRKDPLGRRETVLKATPEMMRTIQKRFYVPNNAVLMITGDVVAKDVFAQADKLYEKWPRGPDPFVKFPLVKHPPIAKNEVVRVEQPVQTVSLMWTWHGPSTVGKGSELGYAADVLGRALGEPASKFQKALVDSGACVHAGFSWYTQSNVGPVTYSLEAQPDKTDECIKAALAELPRFTSEGYFTDEELSNAVRTLEVEQIYSREKPSALAHVLTFWWTSAGLDYYVDYLANLRKVDRAAMKRFLDAYVTGKSSVFGVMVSPEMKDLTQAHFEELLGIKKPAPAGKGAQP
jgi:zinc protease